MALTNSFQGVIFDYGGVLVHHQSEADQARLAELAGIPQELFSELYWSDRLAYDKGLTSAAEYWNRLAQNAGTAFTQNVIDRLTEVDTVSWMQFDSVMWDWIGQLRRTGKRVAILSNMPRDLGEALKHRTARLESFDHVTLSYEVHAAKPEPAAYEHCLEGLAISPEQALFLDDCIANVQGAELLGIRAVQFTNPDAFFRQIGT